MGAWVLGVFSARAVLTKAARDRVGPASVSRQDSCHETGPSLANALSTNMSARPLFRSFLILSLPPSLYPSILISRSALAFSQKPSSPETMLQPLEFPSNRFEVIGSPNSTGRRRVTTLLQAGIIGKAVRVR